MFEDEFPLVEIILATYNGATWIDEMMNSLVGQDYGNWSLIVRDDGSTDSTLEILERWKEKLSSRMSVVQNENNINLGVGGSFSVLLQKSTAEYVMLADQDDIWYPNKISASVLAMMKREMVVGRGCPLLVHTDMTVIDGSGQIRSASGWRYAEIKPLRNISLQRLVFGNVVTGATAILNRPLVDLALPIPSSVTYHDWWIALVASAFGSIEPLSIKTMGYRRHGMNVSELNEIKFFVRWIAVIQTLKSASLMRARLYALLDYPKPIVEAFLGQYYFRLSYKNRVALEAFVGLRGFSPLQRRLSVFKHKLWFHSFIVNLGYLILL